MSTKLYLCDGMLDCSCGGDCYVNGGECMHTTTQWHSISYKYPEFAQTYFVPGPDELLIENIDPSSIMKTFMGSNPKPSLVKLQAIFDND